MAQQLKRKFIADAQIDGEKILLEQNQAIKVKDSSGVTQDLIKLGSSDEILVKGEQISKKSDLDGEVARALAAEQVLDGKITQEVADRISGDNALDVRLDVLEADPVTKSYVDSEVSDLQSQIDNVLSNVDPVALDSLTEIVEAFQSADEDLQGAITTLAQSGSAGIQAEEAARIAADQALQGEIDAEEAARIAADALKVNKAGDSLTGSHSWLVEYAQNETDQVLIQAGSIGVSYIYGNEIYTSSLIGGNLSLNDTGPNYTSQIQMLGGQVTLKYNDVASMPTEEFHASTKKYVDQEVASVESYADSKVLEEKQLREAADAVLDGKISTEKARIDAILDASQADKDSFAEIVQLINSVDLENDNGLASAIQSINSSIATETAARQAADSSLSSDLDDLDGYAQDIRSDLDDLDGYAQDIRSDLDQEVLDRQAGDVSSLNSAKAYTDAQIAAIPAVDLSGINSSISTLNSGLSSEISARTAADSAEEAARIAADNALDARLDVLEAVQVPRIVEDEKHNIGSTLTHVMLDFKAEKIFKVVVGRLNAMKNEDYAVSVEGGKTKLTFIGSFAQGGAEAVETTDDLFCTYSTLDAESNGGGGGGELSYSFSSSLKSNDIQLSNNNLTASRTSTSVGGYVSALVDTPFLISDNQKLYFELSIDQGSGTGTEAFGIVFQTGVPSTFESSSLTIPGYSGSQGPRIVQQAGNVYTQAANSGPVSVLSPGQMTTGSVVGVAIDLGALTCKFFNNGSWTSEVSFSSIFTTEDRIYFAVGPAVIGDSYTKNSVSSNTPAGYTLV